MEVRRLERDNSSKSSPNSNSNSKATGQTSTSDDQETGHLSGYSSSESSSSNSSTISIIDAAAAIIGGNSAVSPSSPSSTTTRDREEVRRIMASELAAAEQSDSSCDSTVSSPSSSSVSPNQRGPSPMQRQRGRNSPLLVKQRATQRCNQGTTGGGQFHTLPQWVHQASVERQQQADRYEAMQQQRPNSPKSLCFFHRQSRFQQQQSFQRRPASFKFPNQRLAAFRTASSSGQFDSEAGSFVGQLQQQQQVSAAKEPNRAPTAAPSSAVQQSFSARRFASSQQALRLHLITTSWLVFVACGTFSVAPQKLFISMFMH